MLDSAKSALLGSSMLRRLFAASRWIFGPAAVAFLVIAGVRARGAFHAVSLHTQLIPLITTVLLWASLNLFVPVFTWIVLRETGATISYGAILKIHVGRLPARYLPGGIWQTVSRMMDLHRLGIDRSQLSALVMLENLVPLSVALTLGGGCMLIAGDIKLLALAAMLVGLVLLACLPFLMRHRLLLHKRGFALRTYSIAALVTIAFWIVAASAFACYWYSFPTTLRDVSRLNVYGAYLLAWSAGFLSIFSPQGIGVFESVISLILKGALPFGEVAVLAAGFRAAMLAADIIAYGAFLVNRHGRRVLRLNQH
jgi:glycosyltransferase 2 family protein